MSVDIMQACDVELEWRANSQVVLASKKQWRTPPSLWGSSKSGRGLRFVEMRGIWCGSANQRVSWAVRSVCPFSSR